MGLVGASDGKESAYKAGDLGSIPGLGISPGRGHGNLLQYSCLENPHEQKSLAGYSPWSHKESDMTEQLSTHTELELPINKTNIFIECLVCARPLISDPHKASHLN